MSGGKAWTPEEDATVRRLRARGMGWREIARRVSGRTAASCRKRILRTLQEADPRDRGDAGFPASVGLPNSLQRNGEPLRPGHPVSWQVITAGTAIEGRTYR